MTDKEISTAETLSMINDKPVNPGSFNEFCAREDITDQKEAVSRYGDELHRFRVELARVAGVSLEDLHDMRGLSHVQSAE